MQYYAYMSASVHSFADKFDTMMKSGSLQKVCRIYLV
jgi:hypothetical protein